MIIDAHVHTGNSAWGDFTPEYLFSLLSDDVEYVICSNLEGIDSPNFKGEMDCNDDMLKICEQFPKIKPLAVCQPNLNSNIDNVVQNIDKFVGLKIHPECMKFPANSEKYDCYMQLAQNKHLPCLFHSGHVKSRFSSPLLIYELAKRFESVPVILGHLSTGPEYCHKIAVDIIKESILENKANLYTDISWVDWNNKEKNSIIYLIEEMIKIDALDRIMFASDAPVGEFSATKELYCSYVESIITAIDEHFGVDSSQIKHKIFYQNAKDLFNL